MTSPLFKLMAATLLMAGWCGPAQAATVPLRSLLESGPGNLGSLRMDGSFFVISKKAAAKPLLLGVASDGLYLNRVDTVTVGAQKEYLVPEERAVFRRAVIDVALKCFNLRPERQAAINTWLDRQNASSLRDVQTDFGPMTLRFIRELADDGQYWTFVRMSRTGKPGVSPWLNYCTP
ncbi:hypothetical protein [Deinococcus kurensis]|uniref:hypothetical protein n=1 Tax=Deinococcus kurensis TaxID=2662757 RepID=UPI0012D2D6C0|nr:hypothetical protein [Deinococcus kurensis]